MAFSFRYLYLQACLALCMLIMPFSSILADSCFEELGLPHHTTVIVEDFDAVKAEMSAVVGIEWREETIETQKVVISGMGAQNITFRRVYSKPGTPFVELVKATPAIGPWDSSANFSPGYFGFSVEKVAESAKALKQNGFNRVAKYKNQYAVYEGAGGILVELVRSDLVPETGLPYTPQAPIDLGTPYRLGWNSTGPNKEAQREQLGNALGFNWEDEFFPVVPIFYDEASGAAVPGVYLTVVDISFSISEFPLVHLENSVVPDLEPTDCDPEQDPCQFQPFNPSANASIYHNNWIVPFGQMENLINQAESAGLELLFDIAPAGQSLIISYKGTGGVIYEFSDESVVPTIPPEE